MPFGDMMGGYGPRPDYGPGSDDYQLGQIKTGFQDAMGRYKTTEDVGERQKAYDDMLHFKDQFDYLQTPTEFRKKDFKPSPVDKMSGGKGSHVKGEGYLDYMMKAYVNKRPIQSLMGGGSSPTGTPYGSQEERKIHPYAKPDFMKFLREQSKSPEEADRMEFMINRQYGDWRRKAFEQAKNIPYKYR